MENIKQNTIPKESASDFFVRIMANHENLRKALEVTADNVDELKRVTELMDDAMFGRVMSEYQALEFLFQDGPGVVLDKPINKRIDN